jgi:SAM-dependent methyltransferase
MIDRKSIGQMMQTRLEEDWQSGNPWWIDSPGSAEFEAIKNARQLALLGGRRYGRALEIGCGTGRFTRLLAGICGEVLSLDIAPSAIERARAETAGAGPGKVELRVANVMEYDPVAEGPWDLVLLIESVYCLGWLYPLFDVAWLATQLFAATRPGGQLLLTNAYGQRKDWLLQPHLINTYRDLFRNVGYEIEAQQVFGGGQFGDDLDVLMCVYTKRAS